MNCTGPAKKFQISQTVTPTSSAMPMPALELLPAEEYRAGIGRLYGCMAHAATPSTEERGSIGRNVAGRAGLCAPPDLMCRRRFLPSSGLLRR